MDLATWIPDGEKPKPPPLWLVSNGVRLVGPVSTTLLVRGAQFGLPRHFHVRATRGRTWRTVGQLREVRLVDETPSERTKRLAGMSGVLGLETLLRLSDATEDTLSLGLGVAAGRLGADFGFVHCFERGRTTPRTRFGLGEGAETRVGAPILESDILANVARARRMALGESRSHHAFRVAASRLGGRSADVVGVAMVPLVVGGGTVGMIELGRTDRAFRASDARALRAIASLVVSRLPRPS